MPEIKPTISKDFNDTLLKKYYGVAVWDIPNNYLCLATSGRVDFVSYLALLAELRPNLKPENLRLLNIGISKSLVYPIIVTHAYS
ncbi:MAG: RlmF-related methyltransferase [Methylophilus sp.]|uniref:RlmF-related methyltransferase n=1 Tax=Methylophilus sp. TaxID=29541 RepID=UPI003F9F9900